MRLKTKIKLYGTIAIALLLGIAVVVSAVFTALTYESEDKDANGNLIFHFDELSPACVKYKDYVFQKCNEKGISDYAYSILAILDLTSAGAVSDVMGVEYFSNQTKYPKGSMNEKYEYHVTDVYYSIDCGISHFKSLLDKANIKNSKNKTKLRQVYQAYHFDTVYFLANYTSANITYSTPYGEKFLNYFTYSVANATKFCSDNDLDTEIKKPFYFNANFAFDVESLVERLQKTGESTFLPPIITCDWSITSAFGYRTHPTTGQYKLHNGIDMTASMNTPIVATADGKVQYAGHGTGTASSYGIYIKIKHNDTYGSLYAHLSSTTVKYGENVKQGQVIGYSGNTGRSTGPHLHFSIQKDGEWVDPTDYIGYSGTAIYTTTKGN